MKKIFTSAILFFFFNTSFCQEITANLKWVAKDNSPTLTDFQMKLNTHLDSEGNLFICGRNYFLLGIDQQLFVSKYDSLGTKLWETNFNTNVHDLFTDSAIDSEGNIIILGLHNGVIGNVRTFELIKVSNNGTILWEIFDDTNPLIRTVYKKIFIDEFDNIYCMGGMANQANEVTFLLTKFSSDGSLEWENEVQLSNPDSDSNINFKVIEDKIIVLFTDLSKYSIQQIELNGETIQTIESDLEHQSWQFSEIDDQGNIYVGHDNEYKVSKMSADGDSLWTYEYPAESSSPPPFSADLSLIRLDSEDNIYICGSHFSDTEGEDFVTTKLSEDGELIWQNRYLSIGSLASSMVQLNDYLAVVGLTVLDTVEFNEQHLLVLYSKETGEQLIEEKYDYQENILDRAYTVSADSQIIYSTGLTSPTRSTSDTTQLLILRYDLETVVNSIDNEIKNNDDINLFPNPVISKIFIDQSLSFNNFSQYEIVNINGEILSKGNLLVDEYSIDISTLALPSGMYLLVLKNDKFSEGTIRRFIVQ